MASASETSLMLLAPWLLGLAGVSLLEWMRRRERARVRADRGAWLEEAAAALERRTESLDESGFPICHGRTGGHPVRLSFRVDHYAPRTVPTLLLEVAIAAPLALEAGEISHLFRRRGAEPWSSHEALPFEVKPGGAPQEELSVRASQAIAAVVPTAGELADCLSLGVRELSCARSGLRFTFAIGRAQRADYLLLRQAHFRGVRVPPTLLEATFALARRIIARHARAALPS